MILLDVLSIHPGLPPQESGDAFFASATLVAVTDTARSLEYVDPCQDVTCTTTVTACTTTPSVCLAGVCTTSVAPDGLTCTDELNTDAVCFHGRCAARVGSVDCDVGGWSSWAYLSETDQTGARRYRVVTTQPFLGSFVYCERERTKRGHRKRGGDPRKVHNTLDEKLPC